MKFKAALMLVRIGLLLALASLASDLLGWGLCGDATCTSGLWERYRYVFGLVPVAGIAMLVTFLIQALWSLYLSDSAAHARYGVAGFWLLAVSVGAALFHVYVQAGLIGEFCLLCLGLTASLLVAVILVPSDIRASAGPCMVAAALGFLAFNFLHHHGPVPGATERGGAEVLSSALAEPSPPVKTSEAAPSLAAAKTVGRADAPVMLEIFSDLVCPHCARFEVEVLPVLMQRYVDRGRLRIIQRSFYAPGHDEAAVADVLAHAAVFVNGPSALQAARQAFFERQGAWPAQPVLALVNIVDPQTLLQAVQAHRGEIKSTLEADLERARGLGITAPPSFAITAGDQQRIIVGMRPPEVFQAAIDQAIQP